MEDIVTYNIAEKLNEKGFSWLCSHYYRVKDKKLFYVFPSEYWGYEERISAPTISQVLNWLRGKDIMVFPVYSTNTSRWYCSIVNADSLDTYKLSLSDSYEEAALAGIEHVLDNNLI